MAPTRSWKMRVYRLITRMSAVFRCFFGAQPQRDSFGEKLIIRFIFLR